MRNRPFFLAALAACAFAASPWLPEAGAAGPPIASAYFEEFKEYWGGAFRKQNGIVMLVLGLGLVSIFIITRSKAKN